MSSQVGAGYEILESQIAAYSSTTIKYFDVNVNKQCEPSIWDLRIKRLRNSQTNNGA